MLLTYFWFLAVKEDTHKHIHLAGVVVLSWQLDFMILEVFSNLNDS